MKPKSVKPGKIELNEQEMSMEMRVESLGGSENSMEASNVRLQTMHGTPQPGIMVPEMDDTPNVQR
jgi:hypothetical protein